MVFQIISHRSASRGVWSLSWQTSDPRVPGTNRINSRFAGLVSVTLGCYELLISMTKVWWTFLLPKRISSPGFFRSYWDCTLIVLVKLLIVSVVSTCRIRYYLVLWTVISVLVPPSDHLNLILWRQRLSAFTVGDLRTSPQTPKICHSFTHFDPNFLILLPPNTGFSA